jgi:hypothetical protein
VERKSNHIDTAAGTIVLFTGLAIIWQSATHLRLGSFRLPGPGLFPLLTGCVVVILATYLLIRPTDGGSSVGFAWPRLKRVLPVYASLIVYFIILEWVGFVIASFGLLLYLSIAIGKQRIGWALVRAVIMTGFSYVLFELVLKTQLPKSFIGGI